LSRPELGRIWEGVADSKGPQPKRMDLFQRNQNINTESGRAHGQGGQIWGGAA